MTGSEPSPGLGQRPLPNDMAASTGEGAAIYRHEWTDVRGERSITRQRASVQHGKGPPPLKRTTGISSHRK